MSTGNPHEVSLGSSNYRVESITNTETPGASKHGQSEMDSSRPATSLSSRICQTRPNTMTSVAWNRSIWNLVSGTTWLPWMTRLSINQGGSLNQPAERPPPPPTSSQILKPAQKSRGWLQQSRLALKDRAPPTNRARRENQEYQMARQEWRSKNP